MGEEFDRTIAAFNLYCDWPLPFRMCQIIKHPLEEEHHRVLGQIRELYLKFGTPRDVRDTPRAMHQLGLLRNYLIAEKIIQHVKSKGIFKRLGKMISKIWTPRKCIEFTNPEAGRKGPLKPLGFKPSESIVGRKRSKSVAPAPKKRPRPAPKKRPQPVSKKRSTRPRSHSDP